MSDSIHTLLAKVMTDVLPIDKKSTNTQHNYRYRGVDAVVNAVGPVLRAYNVVVTPTLVSVAYESTEVGQKRTPTRIAQVVVDYVFRGPAGDTVTARVAGEAMDSGDKSTPKAMSVAWRTALIQVFAIPTGDPDPDAAAYERAKPYTAKELRNKALMKSANREFLLGLLEIAKAKGLANEDVVNENGDDERLEDLIIRKGKELPVRRAQRKSVPAMPEPELTGGIDE